MTGARSLLPWAMGAIIVLLAAALLFALRDELGRAGSERVATVQAKAASPDLQVRISAAAQEASAARSFAMLASVPHSAPL